MLTKYTAIEHVSYICETHLVKILKLVNWRKKLLVIKKVKYLNFK